MLYFVFTVFIYPNGDKSMNLSFKLFSYLSVIRFLLITARTAPKITDNWMDGAYKNSKIKKVLVIGATEKIPSLLFLIHKLPQHLKHIDFD